MKKEKVRLSEIEQYKAKASIESRKKYKESNVNFIKLQINLF